MINLLINPIATKAITPTLELHKQEELRTEQTPKRLKKPEPTTLQKYRAEVLTLFTSIALAAALYFAPEMRYAKRTPDYMRYPTEFMPNPLQPAKPLLKSKKVKPVRAVQETTHNLINKTRLFDAADYGDLSIVRHYIENLRMNPNIKRINRLQEPLLAVAAKEGDINLLTYLLSRPGINLNVRDKYNNTPLIYAAINGNAQIVSELLKYIDPSTINSTNDAGKTALMYAKKYGYQSIVELLVSKGTFIPSTSYKPQPMLSAPTLSPQQKEFIENARPYSGFAKSEMERAKRHSELLNKRKRGPLSTK